MGSVKDGLPGEPDTVYSSNPATVAASWDGFSDPESGLDTSQVEILRTTKGTSHKVEPMAVFTKGIELKLSENKLKFSVNSCKRELIFHLCLITFCEYRACIM